MRATFISLIALLAAAPAVAQTGQVGTPTPETEEGGAVQVGAGTTSHVTTGSSGPDGGQGEDEQPQPIAVDMPYPPQPEGLLGYPGRLEIVPPRTIHCDIITDENARSRCEEGGVPGPEAAAVDNLQTGGGAVSLEAEGAEGGQAEQSGQPGPEGGAPDTPPTPLGRDAQDREEQ